MDLTTASFWKRLRLFVEDVRVGDQERMEERAHIISICIEQENLQKKNICKYCEEPKSGDQFPICLNCEA